MNSLVVEADALTLAAVSLKDWLTDPHRWARLIADLAARLEKMSVEQGIAKNALIVNILWRYIRKDATP